MFPYLFALMVIIFGIVFRIAWFYDSRRSRKNWLCTEGIVYTCRVGSKCDVYGEEFSEPRIKCLYKVKGAAYTITLETINSWNSTQREWEIIARYYPSGFACTVCYDPKNPRHAFVKSPETIVT